MSGIYRVVMTNRVNGPTLVHYFFADTADGARTKAQRHLRANGINPSNYFTKTGAPLEDHHLQANPQILAEAWDRAFEASERDTCKKLQDLGRSVTTPDARHDFAAVQRQLADALNFA